MSKSSRPLVVIALAGDELTRLRAGEALRVDVGEVEVLLVYGESAEDVERVLREARVAIG